LNAQSETLIEMKPPADTRFDTEPRSPEADEELRALRIRVAEMESEKAELETKLKAKEGSRPKEPAKSQGGWYAVLFLVSMLCFIGSYFAPSPEEARPMRTTGGALFLAGMAAKALSRPAKR
jgi:hypothetical protein